MDNLQYSGVYVPIEGLLSSFKPYYKWITFNIYIDSNTWEYDNYGFKPYYKWITFNILHLSFFLRHFAWSFKPYYKWITFNM